MNAYEKMAAEVHRAEEEIAEAEVNNYQEWFCYCPYCEEYQFLMEWFSFGDVNKCHDCGKKFKLVELQTTRLVEG